ncbi:Aldo/keto reductase [Phlegmacium glaucopus]|nr:Aldo/keto reductase [Phlegmacium glaucopus]
MSHWPTPPQPKTGLGRYRVLSPNAGVHVSPIQLGGMSIGDKWGSLMGSMDKESSFQLLDAYFDNGGNFIDTANNYQDGSSEMFIGEWAEARGIRDQLFIATKYSFNFGGRFGDASVPQKILNAGNSAKSLQVSVEASLKKLRTTYIDLIYLHWWDWDTSIEEVMRSLHTLVLQGKVLYLGISDTPAWVVSKANQYARDHAMTPFVIYQGAWNVMERSFEREIIPMARSEGMALAPFRVLAGGKIRTDEEEETRRQTGEKGRTNFTTEWERNEKERTVCKALEKVAAEIGAKHINSVAIAYLMQKIPYVFPIIGGRKVEHLLANLEALEISLSDDQIKYLESVVSFDPGFPASMIGDGQQNSHLLGMTATITKGPLIQPLRPGNWISEGLFKATRPSGNECSSNITSSI